MRIVLAIGIYEPCAGGAAEWLAAYAAWLAERGHAVTIACARADALPPPGCMLRTLPPHEQTKNSWKRARRLQRLVEACEADIVHDTGCLRTADIFHPLMGSLIHNWRRQLRSFPRALAVKRLWHVRLWRDVRLQWQQLRTSRRIIACSEGVARDFRQLGYPGATIIRNGIAPSEDRSTGAIQRLRDSLGAHGRVLMLASATNFYLKGVRTLIRAMTLLDPAVRAKMLLAVTGKDDPAFHSLIAAHGLESCCQLAGWVEDIDLYYQAAEVFLHPTYHDAGSLSTLKAIRAGCAVVTSRFDGSAELLAHGVDGLVLQNPGDARTLSNFMTRLVTEESFRSGLRGAVRALRETVLWDASFMQLEALALSLAPAGRMA